MYKNDKQDRNQEFLPWLSSDIRILSSQVPLNSVHRNRHLTRHCQVYFHTPVSHDELILGDGQNQGVAPTLNPREVMRGELVWDVFHERE